MTAFDMIHAAFGLVKKPEHFCSYTHCDECEEHDRLLRERDRETLAIGDVENPGWDPLCFASTQGIAYYMPTLARFALSEPTREYGWYGEQLIFHLTYEGAGNRFRSFCTSLQREAIVRLLIEMQSFDQAMTGMRTEPHKIADAIDLWRS